MELSEKYISISKAARIKKCHRTTIYTAIENGFIDAVPFEDKRLVVNNKKFEEYISGKSGPASNAFLVSRIDDLEKSIKTLSDNIDKICKHLNIEKI